MTTYDKARIRRHKDSIEESLGFKFKMSYGFFVYENRYFKTLWRMLATGLDDTGNQDIVDTLSVVNRPLACVSRVMERERAADIEQYPEYAWFKEVRNSDLQEKTETKDGRLIATEPFTISGVDVSTGDTLIVVRSSTGIACGAIVFNEGIGTKMILPNTDLLPVGYIDARTTIRFVATITARTYSTKKNIAYIDTKLLPLVKNGIMVGLLRKFISSPNNERVFAKLIAANPMLIKIKTFTINGHTAAQLLTKHFSSIAPRVAKDAIGQVMAFYGSANRPLPKCWQTIVLSENISVEASPSQISMMRTSIDAIFEQESGFDVVLKDTGTGTLYRYTSANKKKDVKEILGAMRMYPAIKDVLRRIPVLAQYSAVVKVLNGRAVTSLQPQDHVLKTGNNKVWMDYDAGILSGTLNKPHSSALSRLLSPSSTKKRTLLKSRYKRLEKLLDNYDSFALCICTFVAMEICMVMKVPFRVRFSEGTKYTRSAILSAMSSQAYMPLPLSMVNPNEAKVLESSVAYGEEKDVEKYLYSIVFDDYKPDIVLSTEIPSAADRSTTNAMRGVTIVSQHAYMVSEVFRIIASKYANGDEARQGIRSFDDVMRISEEVFIPLLDEIKDI